MTEVIPILRSDLKRLTRSDSAPALATAAAAVRRGDRQKRNDEDEHEEANDDQDNVAWEDIDEADGEYEDEE